ncbi:XRE family transcriptional regulator [Parafrankia soli]|uniref:XRE family transcriptional regulator n=1 Tax=Parafrankia soli TaxID=2599596 RepID=A0A1S1RAF2_9ACTN|nr:XRE family transcriptional regulator [Parafrankia soli]OHV42242.1 XRE family transcriptional regulator [Parafrankia soli]
MTVGTEQGIEAVLAAVGPRLRALRKQNGTTLPALSRATGISVSTLSRLESGQRRLTLELLLPLAKAYQVPLDELVGTPPTSDPRVLPRPFERDGMTVVPLTRRPGGLRSFKMIFPPGWPACTRELQTHEGYEWIYVLSGRLHLFLGEREVALTAGEVAEFDTHVPHAFSNPSPEAVEAISLFGPQGERLHVRARPAGSRARDGGLSPP